MKYSQIRIALLTFLLGISSVSLFNSFPKSKTDSAIVIKVCRKYKPKANKVEIDGSACGGGRDTMCDSIPVALLDKQE